MRGMPDTSLSLLERLARGPDPAAWRRPVAGYTQPLRGGGRVNRR
jgi:hypothetical protein